MKVVTSIPLYLYSSYKYASACDKLDEDRYVCFNAKMQNAIFEKKYFSEGNFGSINYL